MLTPCRFVFPLALAGLSASLLLAGARPAAAQYATLNLQSQPGDFIGQGQNYSYVFTPANTQSGYLIGEVISQPNEPQPEFLRFEFLQVFNNPFSVTDSGLDFSTEQLGVPLTPGTYTDAQRASFADPGHPGLDVTLNGRGSNTLTGSFTVTDFTYTTLAPGNFVIDTFDATFEQHSEGEAPALFGQFSYRGTGSPPPAVPEASTTVSFGLLLALGLGGMMLAAKRKKARVAI